MKATPPALSMTMPVTTCNCAPTRPSPLEVSVETKSDSTVAVTTRKEKGHVSTISIPNKKHTPIVPPVVPRFSTGVTAVEKIVAIQPPPASLSLAAPLPPFLPSPFSIKVYSPPRVQATCLGGILVSERTFQTKTTSLVWNESPDNTEYSNKSKDSWFLVPNQHDWATLVKDASLLVALDILRVFVLQGTLYVYFKRGVFCALRKWQRRQSRLCTSIPNSISNHKRSLPKLSNQDATIRGIPNYGQSCFLNSVLQALSCLDSFLVYLERIVQLQQYASFPNACLSETCWYLLQSLHHSSVPPVDPRIILRKISESHSQFEARRGGAVGGEQQDAQELLQALLGKIIEDAQLDQSSKWSSLESAIVRNHCENEIMSLSAFLNQMSEQQQNHNENLTTEMKSDHEKLRDNNDESDKENEQVSTSTAKNDYTVLEEKKQEDFEHSNATESSHENGNEKAPSLHVHALSTNVDDDIVDWDAPLSSAESSLPASTKLMLQTLSPSTPSPLNGWLGSTLQCCNCHHVRPIQNAPFLDIPIVPSSVSHYMSRGGMKQPPETSCRLTNCLSEFTSVERVSDVECRNCTLQHDISKLEEEVFMLEGAVNTVMARKHSGTEQVDGLQSELARAKCKLAILRQVDPDGGDDGLQDLTASMDEIDFGVEPRCKPLKRGMAKKCLLFTRPPNVLCLHVQRRYYDPSTDRMAKTNQHVDFPEFLDLSPYCAYSGNKQGMPSWAGTGLRASRTDDNATRTRAPGKLYRLMSVIEHRGNAFSGHYVTYRRVQHKDANHWVLISDESVVQVRWKDVRRCQAYMLFYETSD